MPPARLRCRIVLASVALAGCAPPSGAPGQSTAARAIEPGASGPRHAWVNGAGARELVEPWSRCAELDDFLADPSDAYDLYARSTLDGVEMSRYSGGSGRAAVFEDQRIHLSRGGCDASVYSLEGGKESLISGVRFVRGIDQASDAAGLAGALLVVDPGSAELAAARMLLSGRDADEASPIQPDHPGRPRGSPAALWTRDVIAAAGIETPWFEDESGGKLDGVLTSRLRDPVRLAARGRWEIWEVRFRARLGGGVLAAYDRRADRTRWILGTEIDTPRRPMRSPGRFDLLSFERDLLLVRTRLDESQFLRAIDLERGVARQVAGGREVTFRRDGAVVIIRESGGAERGIPLAELRP